MAKSKIIVPAAPLSELAGDLMAALTERAGGATYALGDHHKHTWGIKIPDIAFQWLIGHSDTIPCQRYIRVSGATKTLKSTMMVYIGTLFAQQGGLFTYIDNEGKTSATMLDSMTHWCLTPEQLKCVFMRSTSSAEEWQTVLTDLKKFFRDRLSNRPKGQRVPGFAVIDSLMGKSGIAAQEALEKEGHAEERGYPVLAAQITRYLDAFSLLGTTLNVGYVQHMKPDTEGNMKEKGALQAGFSASLGIRAAKGQPISLASHPLFPCRGPTIEGYPIYLNCDMSCLGSDKNKLTVEVLWQQVPVEGSSETRQVTKYNWPGALGELLWSHCYGADKDRVHKFEQERLKSALAFTAPAHKKITCKELGLEEASFTEFGLAIQADAAVTKRIQDYLNIRRYDSVQDADIDWDARGRGDKDKDK